MPEGSNPSAGAKTIDGNFKENIINEQDRPEFLIQDVVGRTSKQSFDVFLVYTHDWHE
jgi:hypothetical protein